MNPEQPGAQPTSNDPSASTPPVAPEQPTFQPTVVAPQQSIPPQPQLPQSPPQPPQQTVLPPAPSPTYGAPAATAMSSYPTANSGFGQKKKLITIIIAAVVALLVVGGAVFALPQLLGASKEDYKKSYDTMQDVKSAYNKMGSSYVSSYATETEAKNDLDTLKTAKADFDKKFEQLGKEKAIKTDKELKAMYKTVADKKPKFDQTVDASVEAYTAVLPAVTKMSKALEDSYSGDTASISEALKAVNAAAEVKDPNNKQFLESLGTNLTKLEGLAVKVQAGRDDFKKYDSKVNDEYYDTLTAVTDSIRDWSSNLQKAAEEGELRDDLKKLDDALFEKSIKK